MPWYRTDQHGCRIGKPLKYGEAIGMNKMLEAMIARYQYNDLICGSCESRMALLPISQRGTFRCNPEYHECISCGYILTLDDIISTFIYMEQEFEEVFPIAMIFVCETGNVMIEGTEMEGERRYNLKRVALSNEAIEDILSTFKKKLGEELNVEIGDLRDLWQI